MKVAVLIALLQACHPNAEVVFVSEGDWTRNEHGDTVCVGDETSSINDVVDLETKVHLIS